MNSKKSNKKQILLSVLALLVILLVGAGVTYSWIEGGTTYTILTENNGDVKTGANPYLNTTVKKNIKLDPSDNGATITLASYDHNTNKDQELYFSPVLSANGSDFFFPTAFDSAQNAISYRKANTNDIGTKFINYKFNVKAEKKCYVAFNGTPTITAKKSETYVSGTSAFRIMLRSGDDRVVFTTGATEVQTPVVTDVNGTAGKLTAKPVSKYEYALDGSNKIFSYDAGDEEEMEVSVWLDGVTASDELVGSDVNLDMELIVAEEKVNITFDAVTYSNTGSALPNGFTGGKIDGNTKLFTRPYVFNSNISAKATANTNYEFKGWYSDKECKQLVTSGATITEPATVETTYYAKFVEKPKYTITVASKTLPSGTGGTVTVNGSGTTYTGYKDSSVNISAVEASGYVFDGWYSDADCTTNIGDNIYMTKSQSIKISANKTYYAKFVKQCVVTIMSVTDDNINDQSGGKVGIALDSDSNLDVNYTTATKIVKYNTPVKLSATPNEGFEFKGIKLSNGTTTWVAQPLTQTITSDVTYYAYFDTKPESTTTIYFESRSGFGTYSAYVYRKVNGTTTHYSGDWPGESATYDSTTGYYKYEFKTTDIGTFNVIVSNNGASQYPGQDQEGLVGTIGKTYLFKANNTLVEFDPNLKYTLTVKPVGTGGSATVNNTSSSSISVYPGTPVTIKATANSGYEFAGWYTDEACTTNIGSNIYMTASQSVTVNSNKTYYAKFVQNTTSTTTIYFAKRDDFSTYYAWVFSDAGANYSGGTWPGTAATYDTSTGYYKYSFNTDDTGTFKVIVSNGNGNQYPSSGGLSGTIGGTYLFAGTKLTTFNPSSLVTITFNATSTDWVDDASAYITLYDNTGGTEFLMTLSSTNVWTVKVPSSITNIQFRRYNPSTDTTWNTWSAGSRGSKTTYKTSGDGSGSWQ